MTSIYRFTFALWLLAASPSTNASIDSIRATANRIRKFDNADPASYQTSTMTAAFPDYGKLMRAVGSDPAAAIQNLTSTQATLDAQLEKEENAFDAFVAGVESLVLLDGMSMPLSEGPSDSPSFVPSGGPTGKPTSGPTSAPTPTKAPSATDFPSGSPSVSVMPSSKPSATPSLRPSGAPTMAPVTAVPTLRTTQGPVTASPTDAPTNAPTHAPTLAPTNAPTNAPTPVPTNAPTNAPTPVPTVPLASAAPTVAECGITQEVRSAEILAILDANAADPALIRDNSTSQGMATEWLIEEDSFRICPDSPKLLQRWAMAVIYYSTGGDDWFQCSDNPAATDNCGADVPFEGAQRFLGNSSECDWAGISCLGGCVTEIEFEENNLIGTIPTEIGLLSDLAIWGMERGNLTSTIPTEIGRLTNLIFLDLDFNDLSGSLSTELLSLASLTQLDVNNNRLTGSISGIGVFPQMEFLQLHDNLFTGTVPPEVGTFTNLAAFTLHETAISGVMPESVCDLLATRPNGGILGSLIADCNLPTPDIVCNCCTDCRDP